MSLIPQHLVTDKGLRQHYFPACLWSMYFDPKLSQLDYTTVQVAQLNRWVQYAALPNQVSSLLTLSQLAIQYAVEPLLVSVAWRLLFLGQRNKEVATEVFPILFELAYTPLLRELLKFCPTPFHELILARYVDSIPDLHFALLCQQALPRQQELIRRVLQYNQAHPQAPIIYPADFQVESWSPDTYQGTSYSDIVEVKELRQIFGSACPVLRLSPRKHYHPSLPSEEITLMHLVEDAYLVISVSEAPWKLHSSVSTDSAMEQDTLYD